MSNSRAMGHIPSWIGTQLADCDGLPAGVLCDVFFGEADSRPAWLLVDAGARVALVPARGARSRCGVIALPVTRAEIAGSPIVEPAMTLCGEPLLRLARHYRVRVDRFATCTAVRGPAFAVAA